MKTPIGLDIEVGQRWREVDPRFNRIVAIVEIDERGEGSVLLRNATKTGGQGSRGYRTTWAKLSRFNGKRGGYAPVIGDE